MYYQQKLISINFTCLGRSRPRTLSGYTLWTTCSREEAVLVSPPCTDRCRSWPGRSPLGHSTCIPRHHSSTRRFRHSQDRRRKAGVQNRRSKLATQRCRPYTRSYCSRATVSSSMSFLDLFQCIVHHACSVDKLRQREWQTWLLPRALPAAVVAQAVTVLAAVPVDPVTAIPLGDCGAVWIVGAKLERRIYAGSGPPYVSVLIPIAVAVERLFLCPGLF